jgi:hypothetical protein
MMMMMMMMRGNPALLSATMCDIVHLALASALQSSK